MIFYVVYKTSYKDCVLQINPSVGGQGLQYSLTAQIKMINVIKGIHKN